jgi:hypothetical protein
MFIYMEGYVGAEVEISMKTRTTIYISESVARQARESIPNLSKWIEERIVAEYGRMESAEELDREIREMLAAIDILQQRRDALRAVSASMDRFTLQAVTKIKDPDVEMIKTPRGAVRALAWWKDDPILAGIGEAGLVAAVEERLKEAD